jgi:hypothetical protein
MRRKIVVGRSAGGPSIVARPSRCLIVARSTTESQRTVALQVEAQCSPEEAYALWSTTEGAKKFFAPAARIDARPGGEYTILFFPEKDPERLSRAISCARACNSRITDSSTTRCGRNRIGGSRAPGRRCWST